MKKVTLSELKKFSKEKLLDLWDEVSKMKVTQDVAEVRGWILEVLEEKEPVLMGKYYDGFYEDEDLRRFLS